MVKFLLTHSYMSSKFFHVLIFTSAQTSKANKIKEI